jgi:hypothetical protein
VRQRLILAMAPLLVGAAFTPGHTVSQQQPREAGCGVERWKVKTLSDKRRYWVHLRDAHRTTVRALRRKTPPSPTGHDTPRRRGVETTVYRIHARLVEMKLEEDSDIHLVIKRLHRPGMMIVEFPHHACISQHARARRRMIRARRRLVARFGRPSSSRWTELSGPATITGVGFFDINHGQTGVAPNAIELHPVIGFRVP